MKGIATTHLSSLWSVLAALTTVSACARLSDAERTLIEADGETFETVVRSQLTDSVAASFGFLRVDERPGGDEGLLIGAAQQPRGFDLAPSADSVSTRATDRIQDRRRDILGELRVEEGGPFSYPECGGARRIRDSLAGAVGETKCPRQPYRYVTVGLPHRGAAPVLEKVRRPESPAPDSSAELWTVLVTETNIGPGGQSWRQYAWLFRRDQFSGRLVLVERFLLSWAE